MMRIPRRAMAASPTYSSFWPVPTMIPCESEGRVSGGKTSGGGGGEGKGGGEVGAYLLFGLSNDSWEDGLGGVLTGHSRLATAGAIVNNDSLLRHDDKRKQYRTNRKEAKEELCETGGKQKWMGALSGGWRNGERRTLFKCDEGKQTRAGALQRAGEGRRGDGGTRALPAVGAVGAGGWGGCACAGRRV